MERECEEGERKVRGSFLVGSSYSKRAGPSTPPPTWRLGLSPPPRLGASSSSNEFLVASDVSVRKLCAELWETEQHFKPLVGLPRCRRRGSDVESPCDHQPPSRGSLRRQIDDHRHGDLLLQPNTPSSSSNHSLEVVKRKPAFSQTGSSMAASYGLGSSTKLLKVLNRIWSLEEQNTANTSLVKALKMELDECRAEIKEVQHREKQSHRRVCKKKEEEEEIKDVFRSMKKELDEEREGRKKSESMHRKLTRELCEAKHCLTKALKDVERERQERVVVEDLCDEFAKAVKDYEDKAIMSNKVIVEIAEVWTDQRLQMKLEEDHRKDGFDAETLLRAKEKRRIHSRTKQDDSDYMHQRVCLKELEERLKRRSRRDNKLQLKRSDHHQVVNLSMSSEGDKIHPETSTPRNVDDLEMSRTFSKNVNVREESRSLKDKLMEARLESRRLRSLKSTPSHPVQPI